ncbi:MAG: hypothetical protein HQL50_02940 [Magnetococcales bacterium]|nr:hypothetical protein [Magnetococcales bacterium]
MKIIGWLAFIAFTSFIGGAWGMMSHYLFVEKRAGSLTSQPETETQDSEVSSTNEGSDSDSSGASGIWFGRMFFSTVPIALFISLFHLFSWMTVCWFVAFGIGFAYRGKKVSNAA